MARSKRIGLLGGTFDPVHNGHLALARAAARRLRLDEVRFIPCGIPPHKSGRGLTPYLHRFAMVALACGANRIYVPSPAEAGKDLTGTRRQYSVDTVKAIRREVGGNAKLYFLMGSDQFRTLPTWKNFRTLAKLCEFAVARRHGDAGEPAAGIDSPGTAVIHPLAMKAVDVSAREIRAGVKRGGRAWKGQVPKAVADYIEAVGLYRTGSGRRSR